MKDLKHCRRFEVLVGDTWVPVAVEQLEVGDVVRGFEPDNTPVAMSRENDMAAKVTDVIGFHVEPVALKAPDVAYDASEVAASSAVYRPVNTNAPT